jgi:hypothetical protein
MRCTLLRVFFALVAMFVLNSCVSMKKVNYPAGTLVTQAPWHPQMNSSVENKPIGSVFYNRWSFFIPISADEGLKEVANLSGAKTLTTVRINPYSFSFLFHALAISAEASKK